MSETMKYGQFVIGAPGSGKTTYCFALEQYFKTVKRKFSIINLDPANENMPYDSKNVAIDINELITLEDAMKEYNLGPNGGLTYCMEFLEKNYEWLEERINSLGDTYLIFDLPGQIELVTNHYSLRNIIQKLSKNINLTLAAIHVVDGICLTDSTRFISTLLMCLTSLTGMEMPFLNILNKINLLADFPKLKFRLNDFLTADGLNYILQAEELNEKMKLSGISEDHPDEYQTIKKGFFLKYKGLNSRISELVEDYANVSLVPFDLTDKRYMAYVVALADKATGFSAAQKYSELEKKLDYDSILEYMCFEAAEDLQERYLDKDED